MFNLVSYNVSTAPDINEISLKQSLSEVNSASFLFVFVEQTKSLKSM